MAMSSSEQRRNADRANALLSTGPATVEGKAQSSRNATQHGLLSRRLVLDDEDPSEFYILARELSQSLRLFGAAEAALVERIAITIWRQQRLVRAETAARAAGRH